MNVFADGDIQCVLGIVQRPQARFQLLAGAGKGVHRVIQLALAGGRGLVANPQALLEQGAQAGVQCMLGLHLACSRNVRTHRHHGMRPLQAVATVLQINFQAVGVVQQILKGAVPTTGPVPCRDPHKQADGQHGEGGKCINRIRKHSESFPRAAGCPTLGGKAFSLPESPVCRQNVPRDRAVTLNG